MKTRRTTFRALTLIALLLSMTPALSHAQAVERGYDGDQSVKSDQRDNEDHETSLDWVGLFGIAGLVGLVGPKRRKEQRERAMKRVLVGATILVTGAALSVGTPALSQDTDKSPNDKGYSIESSQEGKGNRPISIGWIGLIGLAGLLGLGLPWKKKHDTNAGTATR